MTNKRVLVTGASGYIAGKLVPRLLEAGYIVRCMVRDPQKIDHQPWIDQVEVIAADVSIPKSLPPALGGVDTAFYLIHNMSYGHGYQKVERQSAENFAQAAQQAGAAHIIYLGGLVDPQAEIAPHMRSRIETGEVLRRHPVPVTEFRAGVIVGPGSISFEMIRYLCEQFPLLVGPSWLKNRTQPISAENVVDYLIAALENPNGQGQIFEIGGPEVFTYAETILRYAQVRELNRKLLILPTLPTSLMAAVVGRLTPVPKAIAHPLIDGLHSNSIISDPKAKQVFPEVTLSSFQEALSLSLEMLHPRQLEPRWNHNQDQFNYLKSEGFLIESRKLQIHQPAAEAITQLSDWVKQGDKELNIELAGETTLMLQENENLLGCCWIEWKIETQSPGRALLQQTGFFAPRGLSGFLSAILWRNRLRKAFNQIEKLFR